MQQRVLNLRPHHLYCENFMEATFPERGPQFAEASNRLRQMLRSGSNFSVSITEGVDDLCQFCSHNREGRCNHPDGDEEQVGKWDALILRELEFPFGRRVTIEELRTSIKDIHPLRLCLGKCRYSKKGLCGALAVTTREIRENHQLADGARG